MFSFQDFAANIEDFHLSLQRKLANVTESLQKCKSRNHQFVDFFNTEPNKVHEPELLFGITPRRHLGAKFIAHLLNCVDFFEIIQFVFLREDFEQNSNALLHQKLFWIRQLLRKFKAKSVADALNSRHVVY